MIDLTENQILMQVFDFNADDLDANRTGTLTQSQAEKLRKLRRTPLIRQIISLTLSLVLFAFVIVWELTLLCKGLLIFVFVISVLYEGRTILRLLVGVSRDVQELQVESVIGEPAFFSPTVRLPLTTYRVAVDSEQFDVTWEQITVLQELAKAEIAARVYYAAHSRIPVSVELLE